MAEIINIKDYMNNQFEKVKINLTTEDIFNLFLICAHAEETMLIINLNVLMESLAKYKNINRYASIYKNLEVEQNECGKDILNIEKYLEQKIHDRIIVIDPVKKDEFVILGTDEYFDKLSEKYDEHTLSIFKNLMFNIHMDLEYGLNNWTLVAEDEYIEDSIYPGIITGEFIGQEKNKKVMKKVRKRAIERCKNIYE